MGNEIIAAYCRATGATVTEVLNRRRDRQSLTVRNSLLVLTWRHRQAQIDHRTRKKHVLTQIGKEFGMSRVNVYEQIDTFEANLAVNRELRQAFEQIREALG